MKQIIATALIVSICIVTLQTCEETGDGDLYMIEVTPPAINMEIDSTQQFTAIGKDEDRNVIPALTFSWTSSHPNIGIIDEDGLFSGLSAGVTMITAKSGNIESAQASVTVYDPVFSIVLSPDTLTLDYADTGSFTTVGKDINDDNIAGLPFTWESDNTDIASIDENGFITGISAGTTTITASLREVESLPATVTIEMILPSIMTTDVADITENTAIAGGTLIHNGGGELSTVGVCWSLIDPPTIDDNYTSTAVDSSNFNADLNDLYSGTTYFVRTYATNELGTGYGNTVSFTTDAPPPLTDIDGNVYQTIQIGNQVWMAENLKVTHYRDGTEIPFCEYDVNWWVFYRSGAYCYYFNNSSNGFIYGALYTWYTVSDSRNVAPEGWHVPTDEEWKELEMSLGMSQSEADDTGYRGTNEGSKLAGNAGLWNSGALKNNSEFGSSGFTARPGGRKNYSDGFSGYMGDFAFFWSATEGDSTHAWGRKLYSVGSDIYRLSNGHNKKYGFSIRCVRDQIITY